MAAKIGILGESTQLTVTNTTLYTVPADKAARVRIYFVALGGAGVWQYAIYVGSPGVELNFELVCTSGEDIASGVLIATDTYKTSDAGLVTGQSGWTLGVSGSNERVFQPWNQDWFLSTGDTVKFAIGNTALVDGVIQVIGVEDDA
jgi:hypothetical protein